MTYRKRDQNPQRRAAIALLKRGLIGPAEAAMLAGASKQLIARWSALDGVDWRSARHAEIVRLWAEIMATDAVPPSSCSSPTQSDAT